MLVILKNLYFSSFAFHCILLLYNLITNKTFSRWCHGSPVHRYGLFALQWIVEVNGKPTPDLDSFVDATKVCNFCFLARVNNKLEKCMRAMKLHRVFKLNPHAC